MASSLNAFLDLTVSIFVCVSVCMMKAPENLFVKDALLRSKICLRHTRAGLLYTPSIVIEW